MRVVVYDEMEDVALDYDTRKDTLSLCPGRLEKAQVIRGFAGGGLLHHGRIGTDARAPRLSTPCV